jgi:hypothetical protein
MNLSAQEHQTFFSCDLDEGKPEYESMLNIYFQSNEYFILYSDATSMA